MRVYAGRLRQHMSSSAVRGLTSLENVWKYAATRNHQLPRRSGSMAPGGQHQNSKTLRSDRSYPIQAKLHYRVFRERRFQEGRGTTLEISSRRLVFKAEHMIAGGLRIEVWVEWPVRLDNIVALRLHILWRDGTKRGRAHCLEDLACGTTFAHRLHISSPRAGARSQSC